MRFWRPMGMLAVAIGLLATPARSADQENAPATLAATTPPAAPAPASTALPDTSKAKAAKAAPVRQGHVPNRRAWMLGFSFGYGSANFIGAGNDAFALIPPNAFSDNNRQSAGITQFRFAYSALPHMAVGFERTDWKKTINGDQWSLGAATGMGTWYPSRGGYYARAGFGIASAHDKHFPVPGNNANVEYTDDGFAFLGGLGYEYRFWRHFSLALQADYLYGALGKNTAFNMGLGSLGIDWWF